MNEALAEFIVTRETKNGAQRNFLLNAERF